MRSLKMFVFVTWSIIQGGFVSGSIFIFCLKSMGKTLFSCPDCLKQVCFIKCCCLLQEKRIILLRCVAFATDCYVFYIRYLWPKKSIFFFHFMPKSVYWDAYIMQILFLKCLCIFCISSSNNNNNNNEKVLQSQYSWGWI